MIFLYIVDSCYSSLIAVENPREILAANAIEMTSAQGIQSFTQAFCTTIQADPSPCPDPRSAYITMDEFELPVRR
jgi:hypothetical protein